MSAAQEDADAADGSFEVINTSLLFQTMGDVGLPLLRVQVEKKRPLPYAWGSVSWK